MTARSGVSDMESHPQVGYFDDPTQTVPAYDPPHDGPCLVCWKPLSPEDVRTISLMWAEGARSFFFRVHRSCAEDDPGAVEKIEQAILDGASYQNDPWAYMEEQGR